MLSKLFKQLNHLITNTVLVKVIFLLLILLLLNQTYIVWGSWIKLFMDIFMPFFIGFALAYLIDPFVCFAKRKGISEKYSVPVIWILLILLFFLLIMGLLPILYDKLLNFIGSLVIGLEEINDYVVEWVKPEQELGLLHELSVVAIDVLHSYDTWLPNIMSSIPEYMNTFWNYLTTGIFSIIIAIYMQFHFTEIKAMIVKFFERMKKGSGVYFKAVDADISVYLKSLVIIMAIKLVEYSVFYLLIGHQDWLIIALLMALGVMVPYLGGTLANLIGIFTALTLPVHRIIMLIVGIVILSNVDAYVISPLVHEKRSDLGPLVTLLSVFAGGVLAGAVGIMISIPVALGIRSIWNVYRQYHLEEFIEDDRC